MKLTAPQSLSRMAYRFSCAFCVEEEAEGEAEGEAEEEARVGAEPRTADTSSEHTARDPVTHMANKIIISSRHYRLYKKGFIFSYLPLTKTSLVHPPAS